MSDIDLAPASPGAENLYPQIRAQAMRRPWAIHPETLAVIVDMLGYRSRGFRLSREEIDERIGDRQAAFAARRARTGTTGAVAVLPLYGVLAPKAGLVNGASSPAGTGLDAFAQMFRSAMSDPAVGSILIDIDSPGGQVDGVPEVAKMIRDERGQKPIVALANTCAASGAYWIASACDEVVVSPSGEVGSIGVYCAHQDLSGALEQDGVKVTLVSAGKFKVEGNPFEPLSEEALAAIQADVDSIYADFLADVAKGRGITAATVQSDYGEGRTLLARSALKAGMVDRVGTFQDTVNRLASGSVQPGGRRADDAGRTIAVEIVGDTAALEAKLEQRRALAEQAMESGLAATIGSETDTVDVPFAIAGAAAGEIAVPLPVVTVSDAEPGGDLAAETPEGGTPSAPAIDVAALGKPWVRDAVREDMSTTGVTE